MVFRGSGADFRVGARAKPAGQFPPDIKLHVRVAHEKRLRVRIDRDELNTFESLFDHPVYGIDATPADTDHLDDRQIVLRCCHEEGPFRSYASVVFLYRFPAAFSGGRRGCQSRKTISALCRL